MTTNRQRGKIALCLLLCILLAALSGCGLRSPSAQQRETAELLSEYNASYFRETLSSRREQKLYDKMMDCVNSGDGYASIRASSIETINKISLLVMLDSPFVSMSENRYSYRSDDEAEGKNSFWDFLQSENVPFKFTDSAYLEKNTMALSAAKEITDGIEGNSDKYYIVLEIHDWLVENVRYSEDETDNSASAYGALVDKLAQCEGFANAFMLLCELCDIPCFKAFYLGEDIGGEVGHMFNCVMVNDSWYYVDVTNDAFVEGRSIPSGYVAYDYFLVPLSGLSEPNVVNGEIAPLLPETTSDADNWFVRNNLVFDSYSREAVGSAIGKYLNAQKGSGQLGASVKFTDEAAYKKATGTKTERERLAAVIDKYDGYSVDTYNYVKNDRQLILRFYPAE